MLQLSAHCFPLIVANRNYSLLIAAADRCSMLISGIRVCIHCIICCYSLQTATHPCEFLQVLLRIGFDGNLGNVPKNEHTLACRAGELFIMDSSTFHIITTNPGTSFLATTATKSNCHRLQDPTKCVINMKKLYKYAACRITQAPRNNFSLEILRGTLTGSTQPCNPIHKINRPRGTFWSHRQARLSSS